MPYSLCGATCAQPSRARLAGASTTSTNYTLCSEKQLVNDSVKSWLASEQGEFTACAGMELMWCRRECHRPVMPTSSPWQAWPAKAVCPHESLAAGRMQPHKCAVHHFFNWCLTLAAIKGRKEERQRERELWKGTAELWESKESVSEIPEPLALCPI